MTVSVFRRLILRHCPKHVYLSKNIFLCWLESSTYKLIYTRMQPSCIYSFHSGNGFQTPSSTKAMPNHWLKTKWRQEQINQKTERQKHQHITSLNLEEEKESVHLEKNYLSCINFDPWSVLENLFYGIYLCQVTSKSRSCMRIYVVNL